MHNEETQQFHTPPVFWQHQGTEKSKATLTFQFALSEQHIIKSVKECFIPLFRFVLCARLFPP